MTNRARTSPVDATERELLLKALKIWRTRSRRRKQGVLVVLTEDWLSLLIKALEEYQ